MGLLTYLYRGYNPVTKYHGHPSTHQPMPTYILLTNNFASRLPFRCGIPLFRTFWTAVAQEGTNQKKQTQLCCDVFKKKSRKEKTVETLIFQFPIPRCSMYGIFTHMYHGFMGAEHVGKHSHPMEHLFFFIWFTRCRVDRYMIYCLGPGSSQLPLNRELEDEGLVWGMFCG